MFDIDRVVVSGVYGWNDCEVVPLEEYNADVVILLKHHKNELIYFVENDEFYYKLGIILSSYVMDEDEAEYVRGRMAHDVGLIDAEPIPPKDTFDIFTGMAEELCREEDLAMIKRFAGDYA